MKFTKAGTYRKPIIEPLAKRLLYSADTALADLVMGPDEDRHHQLVSDEMLGLIAEGSNNKELVLINSDVADLELIIDQLENSPRNLEYLVIDVEVQGLSFVGQHIASMNNIEAIHLIGHGEPGSFQLGSDTINQALLSSRSEEISSWQDFLSENAAIHLYGCDVASENNDFVDSLADLVGRAVFASEDTTGFSELGGDWVLEYGKDHSAYNNLFDENFAEVYASVLAPNTAPTFEVPDGKLLVNTSGNIDIINDGLVQADGKVLVMGYANDTNWDYLLSRYNSDGTPDESFGTDGVVRLDLGSASEQGFAVTVQADGKIILVGSRPGLNSLGNDYTDDVVVARLNDDGSLDSSFGSSGYTQVDFADADDYARDVIVQPDGSIIVVGEAGRDVGVIKLDSTGLLDPSFGNGGKLSIDVSGNTDLAKAVTRLADGSLVIVGHSIDTSYDFLMINLSQDGSAGPNFNIVRDDLGTNSIDAFYSVIQQSDGKIVVAGSSTLSGYYNSTLVRANLDGSFDSSFGNNGVANEPTLFSSDYAKDVKVLPDGSYITAGWIGNDFSVVKYTSSGALDTSFANGGVYKSPIGGYSVAEAVEVLPDGSIIVIGHFSESGESRTLVFKLDANGVLDQSFAPSSTINDKPTYVEGAAPIVLDASIDIVDAELDALNSGQGNYAGASLTLEREGGANSEDLLAIAGASLIKNGQAIATVDNSTAGRITISFTDANGETPTSQDVDAIFSQITYANNSDAPPASVNLSWTFSDGNSGAQGSGGVATVVEQSTVTITAVDDLPVNSGTPLNDATALLNQDLALDLSGLEVSDADYSGELVRVVLSSTNGEFSGLAGTGVSVQTFANGFIVNGNIDDVNAYLNTAGNVSYNSDTAGLDQVNVSFVVGSVTVSDVDSFNVDVIENTAPVITAPATITVNEDSALNVINGLSITDDASNGNVEVELTTTGGLLNLDLSNLTVVAGSNDSTAITVMGSLPDVNSSLQALNYSPASNVSGSSADSIAISVNDLGSNGGPALTTTGQIVIDISAQNDAPTTSGSYLNTLSVTEGQTSNIDFSGFSVDDIEGGILTLALVPTNGGQLNFNNAANVSITHDSATNAYMISADKDTLNTFLSLSDSVEYSHPDLSLSGNNVDRISIQITDQDLSVSNTGITVVLQAIDVNIQAVNNAPTVSFSDNYTLNEDSTLNITDIQIADSDAGSADVSVTIEAHYGSLTLTQTMGVNSNGSLITQQDGSTIYRLTIVGSVDAINNVIGSLQYTPNQDFYGNGVDSIKVAVNDQGNTGGPAWTASKVATLNIIPTPDPATNTGTIPSELNVTEDQSSPIDLSSLEFSDPDWDVSTSQYTLTLSTSGGGNLNVNSTLPITIQNSGSNSVIVSGRLADLNQLLNDTTSITYLHGVENTNGIAADTLSISLEQVSSDNLAVQQIADIDINIAAQNDAPSITLPTQISATADQNQPLNGISVEDVDAGSANVSLRLAVETGSLFLTQTTGLTVISVVFTNANGDTVNGFELSGSIDDINQALNSLTYTAASNPVGAGADSLSIIINDGGNSGGAALESSHVLDIDVSPQASDPSNSGTLPSILTAIEDTLSPLDLSTVVLVDPDGSASNYQLTLSTNNGQLQVNSATGLTVNLVSSVTVQLSGSLSDLNAWLSNSNGLLYQHNTEHSFGNAVDSLSLSISEGPGFGTSFDLGSSDINISAVNDLATLTTPSSISLLEDSSQSVTGIAINDVDSDSFHIELSVQQGSLNIVGLDVGLLSAGGNGSDFIRLSGKLSDLQQALNNLNYSGPANLNGNQADQITVQLSEENGGTIDNVLSQTIDVNISADNDAPVISAPTTVSVTSGDSIALAGISISDADAASAQISVSVGITQGTLQLGQTTGLAVNPVSFTDGSGNTVTGIELIGSIIDINTALASLSLDSPSGLSTTVTETLTIIANDLGNSGGVAQETSATVSVTISAAQVMTDPSNSGTLPSVLTVVEDTLSPLDLSTIVLVDPDGSASNYQLTLSSNNGQLQVNSATGLTVNLVSPGTVQLRGSLSDLNAWLSNSNGLLYQHNTEHSFGNAADSLSVSISEGPGFGTSIDLGSSDIDISAVNDLATLSTPSSINLSEDSSQVVAGIAINDVDSDSFHVELSVQQGNLNIVGLDVGLLSAGSNNSDFIRLSGSLSELQQALDNLNYNSPANLNGNQADQITVQLSEENSGTIDNVLSQTIDVNISADNDAPIISAPTSTSVTSGDSIILSGISISDVDAGSAQISVSVGITQGTLQLGQTTGLAVNPVSFTDGSGNTVTGIELIGSIIDINTALASLSLDSPSGLSTTVTETLTIIANDLGNSGGVAQETSATVSVTINAVATGADPNNVGGLPSRFTVVEDVRSPLDLSVVEIQDADTSASTYQLTIQASNGELSVSDTTNLTVVFTNAGIVQLSGALADINNWLNNSSGLNYIHSIENNYGPAADSISLSIAEGPSFTTEIALGSVAVDITAVNDIAIITTDTSISLIESSNRDIAVSLSDVDGEEYNIQISSQQGNIYIKNVSPSLITSGENNSNQLGLSGSLAEVQAALSSLSYISPSISVDTLEDQITISVVEINSGSAVNTTNESIDIVILANNEAPQISAPSTIEINTESQLITEIALSDGDAGVSNLELSITISGGSIEISPQGQASVQASSSEEAIVLQGNIIDLNATLQTLIYKNSFEHQENESLQITINDLGSSGGQAKSDSVFITLDLKPSNIAPDSENSLIVIDEDQGYILSLDQFVYIDKYNDSLSIVEVDAGAMSGQLFLNGEKLSDKQTIDPQEITNGNLSYQPASDQNGIALDSIRFRVADSFGEWSEGYTIQINVEAVNDLPSNIGELPENREEQALSWFDVSLEKISAQDIDAYDTELQLRISLVGNGEIEAKMASDLRLIEKSSETIVLSGTLEAINRFLDDQASIKARSTDNLEQNMRISVEINDMGNTGKGDSFWVSLANAEVSIVPFLAPVIDLKSDLDETPENENPVNKDSNIPRVEQTERSDNDNLQDESIVPEVQINTKLDPEPRLVLNSFDIDELNEVVAPPSSLEGEDIYRDNQQEQYDKMKSKLALSKAMSEEVAAYNKAAYQFTDDARDRNSDNSENNEEDSATATIGKVFGAGAGLGLLWWLSRAGSLLAAMISIRPLWNEIDPLPILSRNKSASKGRAEKPKEEESSND
ncbi:DUF4347 domain-containing protein [uncultured Pseudoteredinibacter sp.]|uniref:DUF4347 domain-containing protein n=1 Tax=uncultured Pseudoteredinibacter sp. TaxID=1641701 RepID=UPI0026182F9D|nr:DUF4347 domain-containing protein [uncultured Pseudoteredinibacter sp.]